MIPTLVFDIETIPDIAALRKLQNFPDTISDDNVLQIICHQRREKTGSDFLQHYLQRIVAISCVLRRDDMAEPAIKVWSLGTRDDSEAELIRQFFRGIDKYTPQLVSWNGGGFDLPVLHYRALVNGVTAPRYWELGDDDRDFRYNNYISRYHMRHMDLMDVLAMYQPRANAPLDDMAKLCGFPGKMGMDGSQVAGAFARGEIDDIRAYCETDVANTYLVYLRFQMMRGILDTATYEKECVLLRGYLQIQQGNHWGEFLKRWE